MWNRIVAGRLAENDGITIHDQGIGEGRTIKHNRKNKLFQTLRKEDVPCYPCCLCCGAAPYQNNSDAAQDGIFDHVWIGGFSRAWIAWFTPGGVAFRLKPSTDGFRAIGIFLRMGNENGEHDDVPPALSTPSTMAAHAC